jgi:hypothetical protein
MVTAARPLGEDPTAREVAEQALAENAALREVVAKLIARVEVLEKADDIDEDGPAPRPLPPNWKPLKRAAELSGYSPSALRKLKSPRWWKYDGGRVWVDTEVCPSKGDARHVRDLPHR